MINPITVIYYSRKNFYNGKDIYWYQFSVQDENMTYEDVIPKKFLNITFRLLIKNILLYIMASAKEFVKPIPIDIEKNKIGSLK